MEKFALLNLLKALQSLAPQNQSNLAEKEAPAPQPETPPAPPSTSATVSPPEQYEYPNVMASVLERHEEIANRIRNKH